MNLLHNFPVPALNSAARACSPRFLWMRPNARISVMGGERAASALATVKHDGIAAKSGQRSAEEEEAFKTPIRQQYEERQRAARRLLTCAALCMPDQITALQSCIKKVAEYRYAKEQDRPLPKGVNFKATQDFFNQLPTTITQKHFNFALEPATQDGESQNA